MVILLSRCVVGRDLGQNIVREGHWLQWGRWSKYYWRPFRWKCSENLCKYALFYNVWFQANHFDWHEDDWKFMLSNIWLDPSMEKTSTWLVDPLECSENDLLFHNWVFTITARTEFEHLGHEVNNWTPAPLRVFSAMKDADSQLVNKSTSKQMLIKWMPSVNFGASRTNAECWSLQEKATTLFILKSENYFVLEIDLLSAIIVWLITKYRTVNVSCGLGKQKEKLKFRETGDTDAEAERIGWDQEFTWNILGVSHGATSWSFKLLTPGKSSVYSDTADQGWIFSF
jgi:hypothetical protein